MEECIWLVHGPLPNKKLSTRFNRMHVLSYGPKIPLAAWYAPLHTALREREAKVHAAGNC